MKWHMYATFILIAALTLITGCSMLMKDPEITVKNVAIESISSEKIDLNVTLNVNNPNSAGVTIKSVVFDVYYQQGNNWILIGHGEGGGYAIKPGMNEVMVPVTLKSSEVISAGIGALMKGEITIQIRGTAVPDIFRLNPQIPFTHTTTIPVKL